MVFKTNHKLSQHDQLKKTSTAQMVPSTSFDFLHFVLLICFLCCGSMFLPVSTSNLDHNQLVYKHCGNHTSTDHQRSLSRSIIISSLLQELLEQSNQSKYFATYAGDEEMAILGLFQCRGDLSNDDCYNCVNNLPEVSKSLCGMSIPARVQFSGCYIHYQADEIRTSRLQVLHKSCSTKTGSRGFLEERDGAFAALEQCSLSGQAYCDLIYESLHVVAQCEGNLGNCDCSECVNNAVEIAQDECGYSVSGEIYLDSCYISYGYNKYGINGGSYRDGGSSGTSTKLVAIVVGGIAAASIAVFLCYICRSWGKKKDDF